MATSYENPVERADRLADEAENHANVLGVLLNEAQQQLRVLVEAMGDAMAADIDAGAYAQRQALGVPEKTPVPVDERDRVRLAVEGVIGGPRRPQLRLVHSSSRQPEATGPKLPTGLTGRQQDVWLQVAAGRATAAEVAESLGLPEHRVRRSLRELVGGGHLRGTGAGRFELASTRLVSVGSAS